MNADAERTVSKCECCARNTPTYRHKRKLQLFRAVGVLDIVPMNILGPFPKTKKSQEYIFVITDRFSNLTCATSTSKTTPTHIANLFFGHWIVPNGIPSFLLTDSCVHITSKFFATICALLDVNHLTTTFHHPRKRPSQALQ